ncbi:hypothetical protein FQN53_004319 [Emmonsiellopsis sp. PD_33]|nr:hypothetical protein FQN53_004319 [Emmonsiellopsis sp. PD_33]
MKVILVLSVAFALLSRNPFALEEEGERGIPSMHESDPSSTKDIFAKRAEFFSLFGGHDDLLDNTSHVVPDVARLQLPAVQLVAAPETSLYANQTGDAAQQACRHVELSIRRCANPQGKSAAPRRPDIRAGRVPVAADLTAARADTSASTGMIVVKPAKWRAADGGYCTKDKPSPKPKPTKKPTPTRRPKPTKPSPSKKPKPTVTKPTQTKPTLTKSTLTKPSLTKPTKTKPTKTEPTQTEPTQTEPTQTEPTQTEPTQTEPTQTEPTQIEPTQTEPMQTEPTQTEPTQIEPTQTEPTQTEPTQTEPTQTEPMQTEPTKTKTQTHTSTSTAIPTLTLTYFPDITDEYIHNICIGMRRKLSPKPNEDILTYAGPGSGNRDDSRCGGGKCCKGQYKKDGFNKGIKLTCDEYPFNSAKEGGTHAHVGCIPDFQNTLGGTQLGKFLEEAGLSEGDKYAVKIVGIDCDEVVDDIVPGCTPRKPVRPPR